MADMLSDGEVANFFLFTGEAADSHNNPHHW